MVEDKIAQGLYAFDCLQAESECMGLPKTHADNDLSIDRETLSTTSFDWPPTTFAWCLYESGTHLIPWCYVNEIEKVERIMEGRVHHWYRWDGLALTMYESADALLQYLKGNTSRLQFMITK